MFITAFRGPRLCLLCETWNLSVSKMESIPLLMSSFVYDIKGTPLLTNPTLPTNAGLCIIALKVQEFLR